MNETLFTNYKGKWFFIIKMLKSYRKYFCYRSSFLKWSFTPKKRYYLAIHIMSFLQWLPFYNSFHWLFISKAKARATNKSVFGRYLNDEQELIVSEKGWTTTSENKITWTRNSRKTWTTRINKHKRVET